MQLEEKRAFVNRNIDKVPQTELDLYRFNFACVFTKHSVAMENPLKELPLEEVVSIAKGLATRIDGDVRRNVYNHYQTFQMVAEEAKNNRALTSEFIKDIHESLMGSFMQGGLYRNVDIRIQGSSHIPPSYLKIYDRMERFMFEAEHFSGSALGLAAFSHLQIAKIHPFLDGNGRTARLVLNFQLIKHGYLPVSIPVKKQKEYFNALEEYKVNTNIQAFVDLITELLEKEYDRLIFLIKKFVPDAS